MGDRLIVRFEPYFAEDTDGVHFLVQVDGIDIWAHVGTALLQARYGSANPTEDHLRVFARHRAEIESAVARRVRQDGPEAVILRREDLFGIVAVEIARGLVGEHEPGVSDERTSDRRALPLTA